MSKYRIYFHIDGDVVIEADSEEEAISEFCEMDSNYLTGQTYVQSPQIENIYCED